MSFCSLTCNVMCRVPRWLVWVELGFGCHDRSKLFRGLVLRYRDAGGSHWQTGLHSGSHMTVLATIVLATPHGSAWKCQWKTNWKKLNFIIITDFWTDQTLTAVVTSCMSIPHSQNYIAFLLLSGLLLNSSCSYLINVNNLILIYDLLKVASPNPRPAA